MKRRIRFIGVAAMVLVLVLAFAGTAMAADPSEVDVSWSGGGIVDGVVTSGDDAVTAFHSEGSAHSGAFSAVDSNNNPYGYGVDSCTFTMETAIAGTGWAGLDVDRTDAKLSYGAAGQESYTYVEVLNGNATLQNRVSTNYASMKDSNYGWHSNNHITVTGADAYALERSMDGGSGNFAGIQAMGTGSAALNCMSSEASAGQVRLGLGCGCYTNANYSATGAGFFGVTGVGNNSVTFGGMGITSGAGALSIIANFASSFNISNYSVTAN